MTSSQVSSGLSAPFAAVGVITQEAFEAKICFFAPSHMSSILWTSGIFTIGDEVG